jgi:hypothetical protein
MPFVLGGALLVVVLAGIFISGLGGRSNPPEKAVTAPVAVIPVSGALTETATSSAPTITTAPATPTMRPEPPTATPSLAEDEQQLDSQQFLGDNFLFDDFSSNAIDWYENDEVAVQEIVDGAYMIGLIKADTWAWSYLPVDFFPSYIEFDATALDGEDSGFYGVDCLVQDEDNLYEIRIDTSEQSYSFWQAKAGEWSALTGTEDEWLDARNFQGGPFGTNRVKVICEPDRLALYLNGELEHEVALEPWAKSGEMFIYASTGEDMGPDGYHVLFDNLEAATTVFFEDFSSNSAEWYEDKIDNEFIAQIDENAYLMSIAKLDKSVWAKIPADFIPTFVEFDAQLLTGDDPGTFGVRCYFQDNDNFYDVTLNIEKREFGFWKQENDVWSALTLGDWARLKHLNPEPAGTNRISVSCDMEKMGLSVNGKLEGQVTLGPDVQAGDVQIFIETWDDEMGPEGFELLIDNLLAAQPAE